MTTESWHISVVIPARNEEDLLASCLESVLEARAELSAATSFDLVVVGCGQYFLLLALHTHAAHTTHTGGGPNEHNLSR